MALTADDEYGSGMPFPEKVAWLTLASAVLIYGAFITAAFDTPPADQSVLRVVVLFTTALTVQGVVIAIARPLLALRNPDEAKAPLDERDRAVAYRAFKWAYVTLIGGVVIVAMGVPYAEADWQLTFAAYLTMIVADMVRMAAAIAGYRRGNG